MEEKTHSGQERRKTPRRKANLGVKYILHVDLSKEGKVEFNATTSADIGGGGLCMYTDSRYLVGTKVLLVISFPELQEAIVADARVVHAVRVNEGKSREYKIGLQYLDMKEKDLKFIMDFARER